MLMPKRVKYRKQHRGRRAGMASRGNQIHFGDFGLQAMGPAWLKSPQIEAARSAAATVLEVLRRTMEAGERDMQLASIIDALIPSENAQE